jgi:hypothetical protein
MTFLKSKRTFEGKTSVEDFECRRKISKVHVVLHEPLTSDIKLVSINERACWFGPSR